MIWDVILDDKQARKCNSTTMSYFMKLQEQSGEECKRTQKDTVFLNTEEVIHPPKVSPLPPPMSPNSSYKKPLPINLSTLLPVSKNSLQDVVELQKPSWLQSGTLNIPGLSSVLNKSISSCTSSVIPWPGIEAIKESYMKFHEGKPNIFVKFLSTF